MNVLSAATQKRSSVLHVIVSALPAYALFRSNEQMNKNPA